LRTRAPPLTLLTRLREADTCVYVCAFVPPLRELTWRQIDPFTSEASFTRVVARKRVPTKIPAFSPAEINAPFPPIVVDNAYLPNGDDSFAEREKVDAKVCIE